MTKEIKVAGIDRLAAIELDLKKIHALAKANKAACARMRRNAQLLSDRDARIYECVVPVQNLRKCTASVELYMEMLEFLSDQMAVDAQNIHTLRKLWEERQEAIRQQQEKDKEATK